MATSGDYNIKTVNILFSKLNTDNNYLLQEGVICVLMGLALAVSGYQLCFDESSACCKWVSLNFTGLTLAASGYHLCFECTNTCCKRVSFML